MATPVKYGQSTPPSNLVQYIDEKPLSIANSLTSSNRKNENIDLTTPRDEEEVGKNDGNTPKKNPPPALHSLESS